MVVVEDPPFVFLGLWPWWHIFFMFAGLVSLSFLNRSIDTSPHKLWRGHGGSFFAVCYVGGFLGARCFGLWLEERGCLGGQGFWSCLFQPGAMVSYGGMLGVYFFGGAYGVLSGLGIRRAFDFAVPAGLLGLGVGRLGCFLNADDYGIPTAWVGFENPWWGVVFRAHAVEVVRVPVQILESLGCWCLVGLGSWFSQDGRSGFLGRRSLLGYAILRFFLEYLRGDPRPYFQSAGISQAQGVMVFLFVMLLVWEAGEVWVSLQGEGGADERT